MERFVAQRESALIVAALGEFALEAIAEPAVVESAVEQVVSPSSFLPD